MTPEQAINILDDMAARAPAPRRDHVIAQQAAEVLREFVKQPAPHKAVRQHETGCGEKSELGD